MPRSAVNGFTRKLFKLDRLATLRSVTDEAQARRALPTALPVPTEQPLNALNAVDEALSGGPQPWGGSSRVLVAVMLMRAARSRGLNGKSINA